MNIKCPKCGGWPKGLTASPNDRGVRMANFQAHRIRASHPLIALGVGIFAAARTGIKALEWASELKTCSECGHSYRALG